MKSLFLFVLILSISIQFSGCANAPPFYMAIYEGNVKKVTKLLNEGADINQNSTSSTAYAPIIYAAEHRQFDIVRLLIERGANLNARSPGGGCTTLIVALREEHDDVARLLIEKGADLNSIDVNGLSALGWAAIRGNTNMINLLIDRGADIDSAIIGLEGQAAKFPTFKPALTLIKKIKNEKGKISHGKD